MHNLNIGDTIVRERRALGITQSDLARYLGVHPSLLNDKIPDLVTADPETAQAVGGMIDSFNLKEQSKLVVTADEIWKRVADDPRFKPLLDHLAAA